MAIIKKIINNKIKIQTYNINSLRNNENNSLLYNKNEEQNQTNSQQHALVEAEELSSFSTKISAFL